MRRYPISLEEPNQDKVPLNIREQGKLLICVTFSQTKPSIFTATQGQHTAVLLLKMNNKI